MVKQARGASKKRAAKDIPTTKGRTLKWGQHAPSSGRCISTSLKGAPCLQELPLDKKDRSDNVPYCAKCRKTGDPSLLVKDHPCFGKILVAARKLPKGYRMAWWGNLTTMKKLPEPDWEWALDTGRGIINARPYQKGSLLQFSACPGPREKVTVWMGPNADGNLTKAPQTCLLFSARMDVPKNHQLTMMYNDSIKETEEFFRERGITRSDVGTKKYPCLRKK